MTNGSSYVTFGRDFAFLMQCIYCQILLCTLSSAAVTQTSKHILCHQYYYVQW